MAYQPHYQVYWVVAQLERGPSATPDYQSCIEYIRYELGRPDQRTSRIGNSITNAITHLQYHALSTIFDEMGLPDLPLKERIAYYRLLGHLEK